MRRGQAWLQSLIETTQDAVLSIDRQGRVVLFNPAAERIFGYARDEVIGQKVNMLMAEPYATEHDEYIARYEKTGEARAIGRIRTVTARRKDGEPFPIELSVTEIADGSRGSLCRIHSRHLGENQVAGPAGGKRDDWPLSAARRQRSATSSPIRSTACR